MALKILFGFLIVLVIAVLAVRFAPAPSGGRNFSGFPGWEDYLRDNPPGDALPSAEEQALLEAHRPVFYAGPGEEGPISFYDDYIACGRLVTAAHPQGVEAVTPEILNAARDDFSAVFTHQSCGGAHPVVFGRVDRISKADAPLHRDLTLLTYHSVYRTSGLPAGMPWWQTLPMMAVGDLRDWHQLDHYTSVTIVLNEALRPVAYMLMQHNYQRTFLIEGGGPVEVDIAMGSNELYPHRAGPAMRPCVSFMSLANLRYMIGLDAKPWMASDDATDPARRIDYRLAFLPPSDAFYTFKGWLGARRRLPGRDGPPGALYNTLPMFKPLGIQLSLAFWREGDAGDMSRLPKEESFEAMLGFAQAQAQVLNAALRAD